MEVWKLLMVLLVTLLAIVVVLLGNANKLGNKNASEYITNDKFAVLTGNINMSTGTGTVDISYPSGFTRENCVPIAYAIDVQSNAIHDFGNPSGYQLINIKLWSDKIQLKTSSIKEGTGATGSKPYKLVLMKVS